jgi:hypothetical protein
VSLTAPAFALERRKGGVINPQAHALVAAVVGSSLASAERRGRGAGRGETCLLWTVSAGERAAPLQRPPPPRFPVLFCA